jgi:hypothetical protein
MGRACTRDRSGRPRPQDLTAQPEVPGPGSISVQLTPSGRLRWRGPVLAQFEKSWVSQTVPELSQKTAIPMWVNVLLRMFIR